METPTDLVDAATRQVTSEERDGQPAKVIVARRTFATSIDDLWDSLTNRERLPRWFFPVSGDLRLGGHYALEGNASGEILECDPPKRLSVTWVYDEQTSWVEVELTPAGDGEQTELELRHIAHVPDDFWNEFGPGAVGIGWDLALIGLHHHFTEVPFDGEGWSSSEPGRIFIAASSRAWRDASILAGTPPDAADPAAERTTTFYTGDTG